MDQSSLILFYITLVITSYIATKILLRKFQNYPPSPFPTLPILGHLHLLKHPNSIHRTLSKLSNHLGPVVSLQFGSRQAVLVSSPSAAEDCLHGQNDVTFANRPRFVAGKILGRDYTTMLWAPYGQLWRHHRRIASTEILSPHRLSLLADIRADEVTSLIKKIIYNNNNNNNNNNNEDYGDRRVEIKAAFFEMTNNVMMRMIAGKKMYGGDATSDEARKFREVVKDLMEIGDAATVVDFFPFLKYLRIIHVKKENKFKDISQKMDRFFQNLVDEKRKEFTNSQSNKNNNNKSLIEVLLELQKSDPSYFSDDMIKGLVETLLLAGTETTSNTMEWALSLLLNNPEVLHKAHKEIDEHIGSSNQLIQESDLVHLPYLHCIINETLRMYPVAPLLPPRESSAASVVGGYHVPQGTMLILNIWAIHNDPNVWVNPNEFRPERFENVKGEKIGYQFLPFGSGRRACPGENLAMRIIGLTLGSLIQCFEWENVGDQPVDMQESVGVTMWKSSPLQAKCKPRNSMVELLLSSM